MFWKIRFQHLWQFFQKCSLIGFWRFRFWSVRNICKTIPVIEILVEYNKISIGVWKSANLRIDITVPDREFKSTRVHSQFLLYLRSKRCLLNNGCAISINGFFRFYFNIHDKKLECILITAISFIGSSSAVSLWKWLDIQKES